MARAEAAPRTRLAVVPAGQVELQLGHLCNNRCVFCVSGQRTARGQAGVTPLEPVLERVRAARAAGHTRITLLGGEPTLQPGLFEVLRECARLGFDAVTLFTNGVKTARASYVDALLATGAPLSVRLSFQGATRASHERTTQKPGSFGRLVASLEHLRARAIPVTVNQCLVASNLEGLESFAALLVPAGVTQLHVDLMRPRDAGDRSEAELAATLAPLAAIGDPLRRMVAAFPPGFDVNLGNVPFCLAPDLAPFIHHDGEPTETIAIDGDDRPGEGFDKYAVKARDKVKPAACARCLFEPRCSGVYEAYLRHGGAAALVPVDASRLARLDPERRAFGLHLEPFLARLEAAPSDPALGRLSVEARGLEVVRLRLDGPAPIALELVATTAPGAHARANTFGVRLLAWPSERLRAAAALSHLGARLADAGEPLVTPLALDLVAPPPGTLGAALSRLRGSAPFGALTWTSLLLSDDGRRATLTLVGPGGAARVRFFLSVEGGRARSGYALEPSPEGSRVAAPDHALREGLEAVVSALRTPTR